MAIKNTFIHSYVYTPVNRNLLLNHMQQFVANKSQLYGNKKKY